MTRLGRDAADWQRAEQRTELRAALARAIYAPPRPLGLIRWAPRWHGELAWWCDRGRRAPGRHGTLPA